MVKKLMPIYEIIGLLRDFLAYNLAKYQYFFNETKLIQLILSNYIYYASFNQISLKIWILWPKNLKNITKSAVSLFALFAQTQTLILLLLQHFLIFLLEISKLASQLNLAAI